MYPRSLNHSLLLSLAFCLFLGLGGCASAPQSQQLVDRPPENLPRAAVVTGVPFFAQEQFQCGPAALAMLLGFSAVDVTPEALVPEVYVPGREGSFQVEMLAATRRHGRLALPINGTMETLLRWVGRGEPVLVLQNNGPDWYPVWHYAVVIGYDLEARQVTLHSGVTENYRLPLSTFENTWARSGRWGMVALAPGTLPYADSPERYFQAAAALEETSPRSASDAMWTVAVDAWPRQPQLAMGLANRLYQRGQFESALAAYQGILQASPDYLPAYNNLATLQAEMGYAAQAVETATAGLEIAGGSNAYLEATLAAAQRQMQSLSQ